MGIYIEMFSNMVQTFTIAWFISRFFGCKYHGFVRNIGFLGVWLITFLEVTFVNSMVAYDGALAIISIATLAVYSKIFLKGLFTAHIFLIIFAYAIIFSASSIILFAFTYLSGNNIESLILEFNGFRIAMILIIRTVEFLVFNLVIRLNSEYILTKKEWILFIAMPLMTWSATTIMTNAVIISEEVLPYMFFIAVIMLAINVAIYYFMFKIKQDANTKLEYKLLKMQYDNIRSTEENMRALYDSTYSLKHDLDKHLFAVKEMAKGNNCEEITTYIESIIKNTSDSVQKVIFTDNDIFNAIINIKLQLCKKKNIEIAVSVDNEAVLYLKNEIIAVIFGNIFDNAIEAAEKSENKKINFSVKLKRSYVSIILENTFNKEFSNVDLSTTKKNREEHGFGVRNVKKLVEENNGMIHYFVNGSGMFCCDILLQTGS